MRTVTRGDGSNGGCCDGCAAYQGSAFGALWSRVRSDPYPLPDSKVSLLAFFRGMQNHFARAARRTLDDPADLLPRFDKLIRPNGICLAGSWRVTAAEPRYTGCFAPGTTMRAVLRASVTLRETRSGQYRSFGMAGKLFPGAADDATPVETANFFAIDDNGGTRTRSYLDVDMVSEPGFSLNRSSLAHLPFFLAVNWIQRASDRHPDRRQLYPLARAGLTDPKDTRSPAYLLVRGARSSSRVGASDFRDELHLARAAGGLRFDVLVRDSKAAPWEPLGVIDVTDDVVSDTCDHRLHFRHPRWSPDAA